MYKCFNCKCDIPEGTERKWGKTAFKCEPCMKAYGAATMARKRARERGTDWKPKSVPRHAMLECVNGSHRCTGCSLVKLYSEFPRNKETPCGFDPRCRECRHQARRARMGAVMEKPRCVDEVERKTRRKASFDRYAENNPEALKLAYRKHHLKTYGLTQDSFEWLLTSQNFECYLCKNAETRIHHRTGKVTNLSIDHDHRCCQEKTKSCGECIRHLLCASCNLLVGMAEAKPAHAWRFADYIDLRPLKNYPGEGNW